MARTQKTYKFKIGDKFMLDSIYHIQGIGGDWWERTGEDVTPADIDMSETLVCVRDIKIIIIIDTP